MKYKRMNVGTCSRSSEVTIENGIITDVVFVDGCDGNAKGIRALCIGKTPEEVIEKLSGIRCGMRKTSCPDQLSITLREALQKIKQQQQ